jgi:zinc transporter ZupT
VVRFFTLTAKAFTLSAPLATIGAYFLLILIETGSTVSPKQLMFWVGILLLLSAGSFLYVATIHILPEVYCNTDIHRPHTHHHLPEDHVHDEEHYSKPIELLSIMAGLLTPNLLLVIHEH